MSGTRSVHVMGKIVAVVGSMMQRPRVIPSEIVLIGDDVACPSETAIGSSLRTIV
jgi:uncharacterized Zn-binding protein involved in type VI secretion